MCNTQKFFVIASLISDLDPPASIYFRNAPNHYRRERDHWEDLGVDGWIILGWISRRWDVGMGTGLGWPRIGTGGGRL